MKRILQKVTPFVACAALVSFAAASAEAAPVVVPAGSAKQSIAITAAQNQGNTNPGTLLATLTSPFSINAGQIVGSIIAAVYQNASGFLDFYYQVSNTTVAPPGSTNNWISGLHGANFSTYSTSAAFYSNASAFGGLFLAPSAQSNPLSANRNLSGSVSLWFGPPFSPNRIDPGQTSAILMIATNGKVWSAGTATVENGSPHNSATVGAFQVPEPTSAAFALLGLAVMAGIRRRQKK